MALMGLFMLLLPTNTWLAFCLLSTWCVAHTHRFNDFYSRYTTLLNSNKANTSLDPSTTATSSVGTTTTTTTSSSTPYQSSYVPLSRRRQLEQESPSPEREPTSQVSTTTSAWTSATPTVSPTSTTSTSPHRR